MSGAMLKYWDPNEQGVSVFQMSRNAFGAAWLMHVRASLWNECQLLCNGACRCKKCKMYNACLRLLIHWMSSKTLHAHHPSAAQHSVACTQWHAQGGVRYNRCHTSALQLPV